MSLGTKRDARVEALHVHEAQIRVESGPEAGTTVRVEGGSAVGVGSEETSELRLTDSRVSRRHARAHLSDKGLVLVDEGSRNGTWLGGTRIERVVLTEDVRVRVGNTPLLIEIDKVARVLPLSGHTQIGDAIGVSPAARHIFALIEQVAPSEVTVLIEGESGVGKEVLARAVHELSARRDGPFVTVDCGAIPKELIESELFGHERGAFTGANAARKGLFEQASGGTLFLDEIGELPIEMQPKLLRALEAREVRAVGSNTPRPIDVRFVAATNRRLLDQTATGAFRQDLYYRLSVARLVVPPLRDRVEDVELLASTFYGEVLRKPDAQLPEDVLSLLRCYQWPGNVRELKNVVRRYAFFGFSHLFDGEVPGTTGPKAPPADQGWKGLSYHAARQQVLDRFEAAFIQDALDRAGGVVVHAAELAGMARSSFYRMVERHGQKPPR
jgi:DNA-binding NtrC family response regulator